jgi:hypothetical protein
MEGREIAKLKDFLGKDIEDLKDGILNRSKLENEYASNQLTLHIKDPNSGQEVKLDDDLLEMSRNFSNFIQDYGVNRKNPIIVRFLSGMYILQTCTVLFAAISSLTTPTHHIALLIPITIFTAHLAFHHLLAYYHLCLSPTLAIHLCLACYQLPPKV